MNTVPGRTAAIGLGLVILLAGAPAAANGQEVVQGHEFSALLRSIENWRIQAVGITIRSQYCKPPFEPTKDEARWQIEWVRNGLRGAARELQRIRAEALRRWGTAYTAEFPRLQGMTLGLANFEQYFGIALRLIREVESLVAEKEAALNAAPERDCSKPLVRPRENPPPPPPADDPAAGLTRPVPKPIAFPDLPPYFCSLQQKNDFLAAFSRDVFSPALDNERLAGRYAADVEERAQQFESAGNGQAARQLRRTEGRWASDNYNTHSDKLEEVAAFSRKIHSITVIDCDEKGQPKAAPPPAAGTGFGRGPIFTILGGTRIGQSVGGTATPPAAGPDLPAPGNRVYGVVPTFLTFPGSAVVREVLQLLGEAGGAAYNGYFDEADRFENRATQLLSHFGMRLSVFLQIVNGAARPDRARSWQGGVQPRRAGSDLRLYAEGFWTSLPDHPALATAELNAAAGSVFAGVRDGLLAGATSPTAALATSTDGGYKGALNVGGGVEMNLQRQLFGFAPAIRGGVTVALPIGSPRSENVSLQYGFAAGGVTFQQTDDVTLSIARPVTWGFHGALTLARRQAGRLGWLVEFGIDARQVKTTIAMTTSPSTTSTQPGAIVFSTPAGSRTIVVSTIPSVPSSLSQAVTDHPIYSASGWSIGPVIRVGVVF